MVNDDEVVGHIPLCLSNVMSMFSKFTDSHMEVEGTGKYVNRRAGYGFEITCKYHISGQVKAVAWVSKKVNLVIKEHECVANECKKSKKIKIMNF